MKSTFASVLLGAAMLAAGVAVVVVADQQGWIAGSGTPGVPGACPHGVPESQCVICNPELAEAKSPPAPLPTEGTSIERIASPILSRMLLAPAVVCETNNLRIRLASPDISDIAGLEYARAETRDVTRTISRNAELRFDESRFAHLGSRAPGVIVEVSKDLGDRVAAGDVLAVIDSPELGSAKADYLQAAALVNLWEKNHAREVRLMDTGASTERDILEAETRLVEGRISLSRAAQRLRSLGLAEEKIGRLVESADTGTRLELAAPFDGVVVERNATLGEIVETTQGLFAVADVSRMWAIVDVYEADAHKVSIGQPVVFGNRLSVGDRRAGFVTWISAQIDPATRTVKARAEIENPDGKLRAGMFGTAEIAIFERESMLVVPKESVQWEGCCNVVFVRLSETLFEPRKIQIEHEMDRFVAIRSGLTQDAPIVTTGSFLLKTELMKSSIGAGCCEVVPPGK